MGEVGVKTSLYKYLEEKDEEKDIVIPRIQRDYAQGRKNKATIRKDILSKILSALENANETLTLDFVYGTIEKTADKTVLKPLDGQQRLTTLWLVHWYISFCSGHLNEDSEVLRRFSYETRSSSREFVQALCDEMKKVDACTVVGSIATYIQNQNWFYNEWKYDPTIASMLRMLNDHNIDDKSCIERVFEGKTQSDFIDFRNSLFFESKVQFVILQIKNTEVPIPDRLYIKMNARGKKLSDFENFKSHLLGHVNGEIYKDNMANQNEFSMLLDGKWTNTIWDWARKDWARKGDNKDFNGYIDGLFFSFFNRLVLNKVVLDKSFKDSNMDQNKSFQKLYGSKLNNNNPDDRLISYDGFEVYKKYIDGTFVEELKKIMIAVDKDGEFREVLLPKYDKDKDKKDNYYPASTGQAERCRILAYCIYINWKDITSIDTSKEIFNRWLYIVDNIIINSYIATVPGMVQCIREIGNLGDFIGQYISDVNNDIYNIIKDYEPLNGGGNDTGRQIKEEVEKAKAIYDSNVKVDVTAIEAAEKTAFFKGSIRFLVDEIPNQNNIGTTVWDWSSFGERVKNANKLFSSTEPCIHVDTYKKFLTFLYEKNANLPIVCRIAPNIVDTDKSNFKRQYMKDDLEDIREFLCDNIQNSIDTNKKGPFYDMINSNIIDDMLGEGDKYSIKVENIDGMDICLFYKVVQNSSSYVYVDENHKKWSEELLNIINADISARSVGATYYSNIGYFGKNINIVIDGRTYTWTKAKYENELKIGKNVIKWKETDKTVSIKDKLNELGAGL